MTPAAASSPVEKPAPVARDEVGGLGAGLAVVRDGDSGSPGRLGQEQQGIKAREDADFVALHLVGAAAGVLGAGGGEAIFGFQFCVLAVGAGGAFR